MSLVKAKTRDEDKPINYQNPVASKIQQRRYQILIHSLLYYELDTTLVEDSKWNEWAQELSILQDRNPRIADSVIFAKAFKDFKGDTGMDLPYRDLQIVNIASRLLVGRDEEAYSRLRQVITTPAEYDTYKLNSSTNTTQREVRNIVRNTTTPEVKKGLFRTPRK